jgi:DNA-directed RNA polymerase III subunit RPC11
LQITRAVPLKKKEVDDVLGGEDAWKNVQKTNGAVTAHRS